MAKDFGMGKGIAKEFKERYNGVKELKEQRRVVGDCAVLSRENQLIYYLVTKEKWYELPYLQFLQSFTRDKGSTTTHQLQCQS